MRALLFLALLLGTGACRPSSTSTVDNTPDARESPQASAQPAPLAIQPTTTQSAQPTTAEKALPPPLRGDEQIGADSLSKEPVGYTLSASFRQAEVIGPARAPEVNAMGLEAARKATELRLAIELIPTRMRVALAGHGFVLPPDTEIRARSDRFGHVVLWPGGVTYRPLAPGSLRALFGERRFDVAPITPAEIVTRDEAGKRIGIKTRKVEVTTRAARASFEVGKLDGAGEGGILLCRLLLDLMNAPPATPVCTTDEVPVRAELRWVSHGSLVFELTGVLRRTDVPVSTLLVPPPSATFAALPMPVSGVEQLLGPSELAAFRTNPVDVPPAAGVNGDDLVIVNPSVQLRMLFVDGVPIAWAAPGARDVVKGLHRGRYVAQWRSFLGESVEPAITLPVPGVAQVGQVAAADAGAR